MKKLLLLCLTLSSIMFADGLSNITNATSVTPRSGSYAPVGRSNDPFVFCTQGVPEHNWAPVNPLAGTWRCTRRCKYVNYRWIPVYQSICPRALTRGGWTGPGSGDQYKAAPPNKLVPYKH